MLIFIFIFIIFISLYWFSIFIIKSLYLSIVYFTTIEFKSVCIIKKEKTNSIIYNPYSGFKNYYLYYDNSKTKTSKQDYYYPLGTKLLIKEIKYYKRKSNTLHHQFAFIIKDND